MIIVYCEDPLKARKVDEVYQAEADAAASQGLKYTIFNYEMLVNDNDPIRAVRRVLPEEQATLGVYRGWMLKPNQYARYMLH